MQMSTWSSRQALTLWKGNHRRTTFDLQARFVGFQVIPVTLLPRNLEVELDIRNYKDF